MYLMDILIVLGCCSTRTEAEKLVKTERIYVNGVLVVHPWYKVSYGDTVRDIGCAHTIDKSFKARIQQNLSGFPEVKRRLRLIFELIRKG